MAEGAPLGIVDTLTEGFATLNKRLWLFLIPVVLDLALAFGPGITAVSLVDASLNWAQENISANGGQDQLPDDPTALEALRNSNVVTVAAWQFSSFVASSATGVVRNQEAMDISDLGQFISLVLVLGAGGLLLTSFYLGGIAGALRQQAVDSVFVQRAFQGWLRYLWLVAMVIGLLIPLSLASAVVLTVAGLINELLGAFLATMCFTLLLAGFLYISFADDAMFSAEVGPIRAISYSIVIIRRHFWSALGLIILIQVIQLGLRLALEYVSTQPVGLVGAVVVYAYVGTGLTVGGMMFFLQRLQLWQAQVDQGEAAQQ